MAVYLEYLGSSKVGLHERNFCGTNRSIPYDSQIAISWAHCQQRAILQVLVRPRDSFISELLALRAPQSFTIESQDPERAEPANTFSPVFLINTTGISERVVDRRTRN